MSRSISREARDNAVKGLSTDDAKRIALLRDLRLHEAEPSSSPMVSTRAAEGFSPWRSRLSGAAIGAALVGTLWAATSRTENYTAASKTPAASVISNSVNRAPAPTSFAAAGYVVARRQATVAAEITGRVTAILVDAGQFVRRGTILATLDDRLARADLNGAMGETKSAEAVVRSLQAELEDARATYARVNTLSTQGFSTAAALTTSRSKFLSLQAQLDKSKSDLAVSEDRAQRVLAQAGNHLIRAPFDGVITSCNAQIGEIISPISAGGGFTRTGICTLIDMQSLTIEVDISENYVRHIKVGENAVATLDAYPGVSIPVRVTKILPIANRDKGTFTVQVSPTKLISQMHPNMSAKVTIYSDL